MPPHPYMAYEKKKKKTWSQVTTTTTERALFAQEEDEDVRGMDGMPTQSTRSKKQVKDNNVIFV